MVVWFGKKYFPDSDLIINEAGQNIWEQFDHNRSKYYMQIERAILKGANIDTIGMQYHMFYRMDKEKDMAFAYYNPTNIYNVLDRYSDFNLPIQITEMTIPAYSNNIDDEEIQAEIIEYIYSILFSHKGVSSAVY